MNPVVSHVLTAVVALAVGAALALGTSGGGGGESRTPACREALHIADQGFGYAADFADLSSEGFHTAAEAIRATARRDVSAINASTERINGIRSRMDANTAKLDGLVDDYQRAKAECRS